MNKPTTFSSTDINRRNFLIDIGIPVEEKLSGEDSNNLVAKNKFQQPALEKIINNDLWDDRNAVISLVQESFGMGQESSLNQALVMNDLLLTMEKIDFQFTEGVYGIKEDSKYPLGRSNPFIFSRRDVFNCIYEKYENIFSLVKTDKNAFACVPSIKKFKPRSGLSPIAKHLRSLGLTTHSEDKNTFTHHQKNGYVNLKLTDITLEFVITSLSLEFAGKYNIKPTGKGFSYSEIDAPGNTSESQVSDSKSDTAIGDESEEGPNMKIEGLYMLIQSLDPEERAQLLDRFDPVTPSDDDLKKSVEELGYILVPGDLPIVDQISHLAELEKKK
jgi:hypothetical protein